MSDTLFTDATSTTPGTTIVSAWLNDVNTATYDRLTSVAGTNTITATGPISMTGYAVGQNFYLVPAASNTGAVTLNINGLGAKAVTKYGTTALTAGDMLINGVYEVSYDGTQFQLINPGTFNSTQSVPAGNITGQVAIANGGTGASTASQALINLGATGRLIAVQVFTAGGTYTPTTGMNSVIVEAIGGGAAGGGCVATAAAQCSAGSGGGGGAYTVGRFVAPGSQTITIGAAGTGVSGANGNNGGATSFGALLTAPGGLGGIMNGSNAFNRSPGGLGGALGTGGNIKAIRGCPGGFLYNSQPFGFPGLGGNSPFGGSSAGQVTGIAATGPTATEYGAGGSGAANDASNATPRAGANGAGGLLIVYEYS